MKHSAFLLTFFLVLFAGAAGFAADSPVPSSTEEEIGKLLETLENDTAREELVSNLKLLLEHQKKEQALDETKPLTEQLGVRGFSQQMLAKYEAFLGRNDLSDGTFRRLASTLVTVLGFLGLLAGIRYLTRRMLTGFSGLADKYDLSLPRLKFYVRTLRLVALTTVVGLFAYTLSEIWSLAFAKVFTGEVMSSIVPTVLNIGFVAFLAAFVWEGISMALSKMLKGAEEGNAARIGTLLPLIRNIAFVVFAGLFGLIVLSELGINVAPLLAGAGIVGVAVGFGAQTMVKDFLTGFTIVLEDLIRVGDVVRIAGNLGVVEKITLRKVQLRDVAGIVYTVPYSEITTIENQTKDFSYYVFDVGVSYSEDTDRVADVLRRISLEMQQDTDFGPLILEPLEILGVDRFADSAVMLKARIKTLPIKQWVVGREFNRRMKQAFDAAGIEIPFPQRTVTVRSEGVGFSAAAPALSKAVEAVSE
jgi:small-conductance mechanosensitive channel